MDRFTQTLIGEGFAGNGRNAAHINIYLGRKGGAVDQAMVAAAANPKPGVIPFLAVLKPNLPVQPFTLFINKAEIKDQIHGRLTWGAAQAGVAGGVTEAVARGLIPAAEVQNLAVVCTVWVDPAAETDQEVYENNLTATLSAIQMALAGGPPLEVALAARERPENPFFSPARG